MSKIVLVQRVFLFDTKIWGMGYLTQTQTLTPSMFPLILSLQIPVTQDAMVALPELILLVVVLLIRKKLCLRCAGFQEQEFFPDCCGEPGLLPVTGCDRLLDLPEEKVCPWQVVNMLGRKWYRRHFCPQSYLEVWNKSSRWNREWKQAA